MGISVEATTSMRIVPNEAAAGKYLNILLMS
jgi:hypothetical protein